MAKIEEKLKIHETVIQLKAVLRSALDMLGCIEDCNKPLEYYMLLNHVCDEYLVNPVSVVSRDKHGPIAEARHMLLHILVKVHGYSCDTVGAWIGGRDRSTVHHSVTIANNLMDTDKKFKERYERVLQRYATRKKILESL